MNTIILWIYCASIRFLPESRCYGFKCWLLRKAGAKIGSNVRIYSSTKFLGAGNLEIGDDVFIGPNSIFQANAGSTLKIGNHVNIGAMTYITTGTHLIDIEGVRSCGEGFVRDVEIMDGAWLTVHVLVLPGVLTPKLTIGKKAMVMGGSVITSSVPDYAMMQGNPAKKKGEVRAV